MGRSALRDLTGFSWGKRKVLRLAPRRTEKRNEWLVECACGSRAFIRTEDIGSESRRQCQSCRVKERNKTHGLYHSPEYRSWHAMKNRCHNPKSDNYHLYGARGVRVCVPWRKSFMAFYEYMGRRPSSQHTLDRKNTNGNYEPGNVRWATKKQQARNRRTVASLEPYRVAIERLQVMVGAKTIQGLERKVRRLL